MEINKLLLVFLLITSASCKGKNTSSVSEEGGTSKSVSLYDEPEDEEEKYPDGSYCASVEYYNSNTGTRSIYQLTVEVERGELTQINWPNGGWTDDTHFSPEELDEDGSVSFSTYEGYEYEVTIEEEGPCMTVSSKAVSPSEAAKQHVGEDEGYVLWEATGCNYVIIESGGWYVVADKSYGSYFLSRGTRVRGELGSFGFQEFYNLSSGSEEKVYVDNYYASKSRALEMVFEKCDLGTEESY